MFNELSLALGLMVALGAAWIGHHLTAVSYEAKIAEYQIKLLNENLETQRKVADRQIQLQADTQRQAQLLEDGIEVLDQEFNAALLSVHFPFRTSDVDVPSEPEHGGVREDGAKASPSLPSTAGTPGKHSEPQACKCNCPDARKLQRLYERQLMIARDCDINDKHRQTVIEIYNNVVHAHSSWSPQVQSPERSQVHSD